MITNHGIHQWQVLPGLPDTGGQNVFVNLFTAALACEGFKITIVNRGGYRHPLTGEARCGLRYQDAHQRILYLDDGLDAFVRKEEMAARLPALAASLQAFLAAEGTDVALILSHYWDGAALGVRYNQTLRQPVPHIWIPHSLGTVKRRNVAPARWPELHLAERIALERELVAQVAGVAATSATIRQALHVDYGYDGLELFLPPCVDTARYYPREVAENGPVWDFLSSRAGLTPDGVRQANIITEISRTDTTKRKSVLIKAFARVQQQHPQTLLLVAIDERQQPLASELQALIRNLGVEKYVVAVGSVGEWLPTLYAVTDVYCTPSVMEGFGMSAQEAAATGVPVVASELVPFATEYLLGARVQRVDGLRWGAGGVVVPADDVAGFARALERLLDDAPLRQRMGQRAYDITVPYFTWEARVPHFLNLLPDVSLQ